MKKEDLVKLGLDEEAAVKAANASAEELKGYIPKSRFDEVNGEVKNLKELLAERDGQLNTLKSSTGDAAALKKQIERLQDDNKTKDETHAAEMQALRVNAAVDTALTGAKAKNLTAVKALLKFEGAELGEDGTVKGLKEQLDALAKSDAYLFEGKTKPNIKGAAPGQSGKEDPDNKVDTSKMSYEELAAYMTENPDAEI